MGNRSRPGTRVGSRVRVWVAGGTALYGVIFLLLMARPVNHSDEAWFLWIAHRVAQGQVLYRDVYSVTTPLPTWLASIGVWLFGTQLLVVRALSVACITASMLLALAIAARCGLGRRGRALLLVGIVLAGSPLAHFASIYSQLAIAGAMATLALTLAWLDGAGPGRRLLMTAGFAAGVSCASKPNIGMLAVAALLTVVVAHTVAVRGRHAVAPAVALVLVPYLAVVGLMVTVIVAQGAFGAFVSDVFSDKPEYLRLLGTAFPPGGAQLVNLPTARGFSMFLGTQGLMVMVALGVVAWAIQRTWRARRAQGLAIALFAVVGLLAAYPQAGPQHLTEAMPLVLATAGAAVGLIGRAHPARTRLWARTGVGLVATWLTVGTILFAGFLVERAPTALADDNPHHFAGTIAYSQWHAHLGDLRTLRRITGGKVFILSANASFYYLTGGLRNPLPYDFPVLSDFGGGGERGITRRIASGHTRWICVGHPPRHAGLGPRVQPVRLERWIRRHLPVAAHLPLCDLYRGRREHPAAVPGPAGSEPQPDRSEWSEAFLFA